MENFRFMLKEAGLKKSELATMIGMRPETISSWGDSPPEYIMWGLRNYIEAKHCHEFQAALRRLLGV